MRIKTWFPKPSQRSKISDNPGHHVRHATLAGHLHSKDSFVDSSMSALDDGDNADEYDDGEGDQDDGMMMKTMTMAMLMVMMRRRW